MDIKELNKTQLILLSLLITFVVSIATGIVTVSLMQQMPESVPQTINNVIQRTIEKVTTVEVPAISQSDNSTDEKQNFLFLGDGDVVVSIYPFEEVIPQVTDDLNNSIPENDSSTGNMNGEGSSSKSPKILGQGIIISDVGLILVESKILDGYEKYKVILNKIDFEVSVLKKYENGFTILKIISKQDSNNAGIEEKTDSPETPTL